jgi:hypothetical protein
MINFNLGGACPRRPLTHAISRAMLHPIGPADASIKDFELGVVASNGTMREGVETMFDIALRSNRPWLLANFPDDVTSQCDSLVLIKPVEDGLLIGMFEPCIVRPGAPMILVATDRSCAFKAGDAGKLIECAMPRPTRLAAGLERARTELIRRMRAVITDTGVFRHESWELHIIPTTASAH